MWLVAIVMDTAFLNTIKVNVQQLKMHLEKKKKRIFLMIPQKGQEVTIICSKRIFF